MCATKQNVLNEAVSKLPIGATVLIELILQEFCPLCKQPSSGYTGADIEMCSSLNKTTIWTLVVSTGMHLSSVPSVLSSGAETRGLFREQYTIHASFESRIASRADQATWSKRAWDQPKPPLLEFLSIIFGGGPV